MSATFHVTRGTNGDWHVTAHKGKRTMRLVCFQRRVQADNARQQFSALVDGCTCRAASVHANCPRHSWRATP